MSVHTAYYNKSYDVSNCDAEPINFIRFIQSYGAIIITDISLTKVLAITNHPQVQSIAQMEDLEKCFLRSTWEPIVNFVLQGGDDDSDPPELITEDRQYAVLLHKRTDIVIWEFEPVGATVHYQKYLGKLNRAINKVSKRSSLEEVLETAIDEVASLMGYDHVLLYKFDDKDDGTVISERRTGARPSYLHLKFPASDIPTQARQLFVAERVRMIEDTFSSPNPLQIIDPSMNGHDVDLTFIACRGVSPIHLEYLRNMGIRASLSCAIVQEGRLWGLIIGHNQSPKFITQSERDWLFTLSNIISSFITVFRNQQTLTTKIETNKLRNQLIAALHSKGTFNEILQFSPQLLSEAVLCDGIIIREKGVVFTHGKTPSKKSLRALIAYFSSVPSFNIFHDHGVARNIQELNAYPDLAGILAIEISKAKSEYLIWARTSQDQEVIWAGNPTKTVDFSLKKNRLQPRSSFDIWKQLNKGYSIEWTANEITIIDELRREIDAYFYKKYDELNDLHNQLENSYKLLESFSYSVSHDLKASVRNIAGFAEILQKDSATLLDEQGTLLLEAIIKSTKRMKHFIDDILTFSKAQNPNYRFEMIDIAELIGQITAEQRLLLNDSINIKEKISGNVYGDRTALYQVLSNLVDNAIKYSRHQEIIEITIEGTEQEDYMEISVSDNGIGFDQAKAPELFRVFNRLVRDEEYEGSGVGLSIAQRVVKKHNGTIRAEGKIGEGATFIFTLPKTKDARFQSK